jgi:DNA mismatch repair protein MutS
MSGPIAETPLMKQYNAIKAKYPGTILLFRVGDFYETFSEDAITVSRILGIVLTKRANGSAMHIELAGFPHHSLDSYLPRLVRAGCRVAVCDQMEDPKFAKGIVKRAVTELVTPGVAISDKILDAHTSNYLAAVHWVDAHFLGAAFIEVSTGDFFCLSGDVQQIEKVVNSLLPAEVLVPRKDLREFRLQISDKLYTTRQEDWIFQLDYARERLLEHFKTTSLKGFGLEEERAGVTASGAILHYLRESQQEHLGHVTTLTRFDDSEYVWLDEFTIRNLELLRPNHADGKALIDVLDHTLTPMGARLLRRWILFPLKDLGAVQQRLGVVEALLHDGDSRALLAKRLREVGDLERLVSKLATLRMMPREALLLRQSLHLIRPLREILAAFGSETLNQLATGFRDVGSPLDLLAHYLSEDPPSQIAQGGVIRDGVNAELDELRALSTNGKDLLLQMQQREIQRTGISSLKVSYNKVFGYYLEVTHAHKDKVPAEWIRKQTLTNAERYITDELKQYEDKILGAEERMLALETQLYQEMLNRLQDHLIAIQKNANLIAELDVYHSFSDAAKELGYVRPTVNDGELLDIRNGRHPVIERTLPAGQPYIPNDVLLDNEEQQIIIITGPNMAGKSALLRQTALIVLLAQVGSFVPADSATIGLVDKIFTRVGASDNLSAGESTFMVEMNETARILNTATRRSLVLLDEIGRGTSTYDGVSIAWALVEYLHESTKNAAKTLFATHYHELNEISSRMGRVRNFNVSVKEVEGKILFLRKLQPGGSEHSFGIHVAEMAGMPRTLVARANELLHHFEQSKMDNRASAKNVRFSSKQNIQLNMFELKDHDTLRIRQILAGVDIDRMTPVEALLKLQEIKRALVE